MLTIHEVWYANPISIRNRYRSVPTVHLGHLRTLNLALENVEQVILF